MTPFKGNIFIIGCGAVTQSCLPLILKHINILPHQIFIIDSLDKKEAISTFLDQGVHFEQKKITKENFAELLKNHLKAGDMCIDLANEIDTYDLLSWCTQNNVMYFNTCLNQWATDKKLSLYEQYKQLKNFAIQNNQVPTSILSHGANPGLISSFVKKALVDLAHHRLKKNNKTNHTIKTALADKQFNHLAQALDIRYIHISEIDSQNYTPINLSKTFFNTWSAVEFINECKAPIEFAWGTHEKDVFAHAKIENGFISFPTLGLHSQAKSQILNEEFNGMIITHDETHSIANFLSIIKNEKIIYRPTILFIYSPCPLAQESLKRLSLNNQRPDQEHIITSEITHGTDKMGCLIRSSSNSWWTGTLLNIKESNRILPGHNSTVLQVSAGVIAGLCYMINNSMKGILFPEQLDHTEILDTAAPYLGSLPSQEIHTPSSEDESCKEYIIKI